MVSTKNLRLSAACALAVLAAVTGPSDARAGVNLVQNGTFTTSSGGTLQRGQIVGGNPLANWSTPAGSGNSYAFLFLSSDATGTGDLPGGSISLYGPASQYALPAPATGNFVGMDGAYQVGPLSQSITGLVAGNQYAVSFDWAGAQQTGFSGTEPCGPSQPGVSNCTDSQWDVFLGTVPTVNSSENPNPYSAANGQQLNTPVAITPDHGFTGWMAQTLVFTADATTETLSFIAQGKLGSSEPPFALLADVSLNKVPEPTTVAIMLAGLTAIGVVGFKRRKR